MYGNGLTAPKKWQDWNKNNILQSVKGQSCYQKISGLPEVILKKFALTYVAWFYDPSSGKEEEIFKLDLDKLAYLCSFNHLYSHKTKEN